MTTCIHQITLINNNSETLAAQQAKYLTKNSILYETKHVNNTVQK